jgi:hypothetical protein
LFQASKQGVVLGDVVGNDAGATLNCGQVVIAKALYP